jgi:serine/threonine protein kinase
MNNNNDGKPKKSSRGIAKSLGNYLLLKNSLGKGAYAEVFEGFKREGKTPVAIKVIPRSKLNDKLMSSLEQEINIMRRIDHENIIRLYDVHVCVLSHLVSIKLTLYINVEK